MNNDTYIKPMTRLRIFTQSMGMLNDGITFSASRDILDADHIQFMKDG